MDGLALDGDAVFVEEPVPGVRDDADLSTEEQLADVEVEERRFAEVADVFELGEKGLQ